MKKTLLFFCIFIFTATISYSQTFLFKRISPRIVNGDTSIYNQTVSYGILKNLTSGTLNFKLVRVNMNMPSGWLQSVCTPENCFGPEADTIPPAGLGHYAVTAGRTDTISFDFYGQTVGTGYVVWKAFAEGTPGVFQADTFGVHLGPVGITPISSIVKDFELRQNYPNPFNPSTSIIFSLAKNSEVSLIVYDMQGREVTRLLNNSRLTQGSYKYDFNTGDFNLSSGAYFYRLVTGDYVSTRKMLLIK
jgi:hypothetical protein